MYILYSTSYVSILKILFPAVLQVSSSKEESSDHDEANFITGSKMNVVGAGSLFVLRGVKETCITNSE